MLSTMDTSTHLTGKKIQVMYWQCIGKRTLQCKARLYSRCLGGVEACYSSLQFNHKNQELLRLHGFTAAYIR